MQKKTPEQQAAEAAVKEAERAEALVQRTTEAAEAKARQEEEAAKAKVRKDAAQREKQRRAFFESPVGQARLAFEQDDVVFQCSSDVMSQPGIIVGLAHLAIAAVMGGSDTEQSTNDPAYVLNRICREGWELVTGSFVFIEQQLESRDNFMSTGQNVAIKGKTVGYYLFRRCPENRREFRHSWETAATPVT